MFVYDCVLVCDVMMWVLCLHCIFNCWIVGTCTASLNYAFFHFGVWWSMMLHGYVDVMIYILLLFMHCLMCGLFCGFDIRTSIANYYHVYVVCGVLNCVLYDAFGFPFCVFVILCSVCAYDVCVCLCVVCVRLLLHN